MAEEMKPLVAEWFGKWKAGDYRNLPISDRFTHASPFGTLEGKRAYLDLVKSNEAKFLGYRFEIHDGIYEADRACVRYTAIQGDFRLDVSEWYYPDASALNLIGAIVSHYHIGEIRSDRALDPEER